jgi:HD-like signal output (HDOD) protein
MLAGHTIDLLILDNEMPRVSGLAVLRKLRVDNRYKKLPVLMLTVTTARDVVVQAMRLGVCGYILKAGFSIDDILSRIDHILQSTQASAGPPENPEIARVSAAILGPEGAPTVTSAAPVGSAPATGAGPVAAASPKSSGSNIPTLVPPGAAKKAVAEVAAAKTLAGVVSEIISLTNSPRMNLSDICVTLRKDPLLAARVVQLASSSAYAGSKNRVASLDEAVRTVGATAVRQLAQSVGIFDTFPPGKADGLDLLRCWQHAFCVATIMGRIVPKSDAVPPGLPHVVGLCHDLLEMLLRQRFPKEYTAAVEFAVQNQRSVIDAVSEVFGTPYPELVETMLNEMTLPPSIAEPIKLFFQHSRGTVEQHAGPLVHSLAIANQIAHGLLLTSEASNVIAPVVAADCHSLVIPTSSLNWADVRAEAVTTTCILAKVPQDQEAEMVKPLLPQGRASVWYVRPACFAALDPVDAALQSLCKVHTADVVPQPQELAGIGGLVVVSSATETSALGELQRLRQHSERLPPVLHLSAPGYHSDSPTPSGMEEIHYPIPMQRLAKFTSALRPAA